MPDTPRTPRPAGAGRTALVVAMIFAPFLVVVVLLYVGLHDKNPTPKWHRQPKVESAAPATPDKTPATPQVSNAEAVCGTWVLQQVSGQAELTRWSEAIGSALAVPHVRGFSMRVPWKAVDRDFELLESGLALARAHKVDFSVRFMAGRHTPGRVFNEGNAAFYTKGQEKIPLPFKGDGTPNVEFEREYEAFVSKLALWCRTNQVRLLHLAWYGQDWAELNHGREVRAQRGYTYERWLAGHIRLLDIGLKHAGPDLAVELPFSGYGPLTQAAVALADHVVQRIGPANPAFFCQANGWGPDGDWGAPNRETEEAFDNVWSRPVCRGQQAIQPDDYDWQAVFARLYENRATYCEVYTPSFSKARKDVLAAEIARFAEACAKGPPLPSRD